MYVHLRYTTSEGIEFITLWLIAERLAMIYPQASSRWIFAANFKLALFLSLLFDIEVTSSGFLQFWPYLGYGKSIELKTNNSLIQMGLPRSNS